MQTYQILVWDYFDESGKPSSSLTMQLPEGTTCPALVRNAKLLLGWSGKRCKRTVTEEALHLQPYATCLSAEVFPV